jgi:hypothetical protein
MPDQDRPATGAMSRACQPDTPTRRRNVAMFLTIGTLALPKSRRAAGPVAGGGGSPIAVRGQAGSSGSELELGGWVVGASR